MLPKCLVHGSTTFCPPDPLPPPPLDVAPPVTELLVAPPPLDVVALAVEVVPVAVVPVSFGVLEHAANATPDRPANHAARCSFFGGSLVDSS